MLLPPWFRLGTNCKLTSTTQLENFPAHIRLKSENISDSILEELQQSQFLKRGYSASLIRYSYASIQFLSAIYVLLKNFFLTCHKVNLQTFRLK